MTGPARPFAEIATGDLDVPIVGQLPAANFPLSDEFEPGSVQVVSFEAPFGRGGLWKQDLEHAPGNAHHVSEAARAEDGPHAPELATTTLRALAIPEIVACRSRLVPEMTVFSAQADDHRAIYVGGIADAVAYQPEGSVDLVIDWKTDVNPTTQQIDLYREQMHDYLTALAAPEGLLVFVTSGQLVHVRAFQPSAGAA
jgi:hypothetical protein